MIRTTDRGARQVFEATRRVLYDGTSARSTFHPFRETNPGHILICKAPAGGIAAVSGTTVTGVDCDVYQIDDSEDLVVYQEQSTTVQQKVYNPYTTAITANSFILAGREHATGRYVVIAEDC